MQGEKKLEEIQRLTVATKKLIMMFSDPWEQLTFRHVGNQGRIFNATEDRYLLCLTHVHGYGNWEQVRSSIRRCDRFRFDFYIQACTAEALGKRCEVLMRAAEREVNEVEKKKQAVDSLAASSAKPKDLNELNKAKLEGLLKEIKVESARLAQARSQLQQLKSAPKPAAKAAEGKSAVKGVKEDEAAEAPAKATKKKGKAAPDADTSTGGAKVGGPRSLVIPNSRLPELCRLIRDAGPEGVSRVVEKFSAIHPSYAKRQVEIKINELAIKEKRPNDTKQVWYILPQYEHYLAMEIDDAPAEAPSVERRVGAKPGRKPRVYAEGEEPVTAAKKRKRAAEADEPTPTAKSSAGEPKKFKRAFGWFVKETRQEAEEAAKDPNVSHLYC